MLDHVGVNVRDFATARAFYAAALEPLGIVPVMEFPGFPAASATVRNPISGSASATSRRRPPTSPSPAPTARPSTPFTRRRSPPAAATTAARACVPTTSTTTGPSSSTRTATTSRPSAICRRVLKRVRRLRLMISARTGRAYGNLRRAPLVLAGAAAGLLLIVASANSAFTATDAGGDSLVAWQGPDRNPGVNGRIQARTFSAAGTLGALQYLSPADENANSS